MLYSSVPSPRSGPAPSPRWGPGRMLRRSRFGQPRGSALAGGGACSVGYMVMMALAMVTFIVLSNDLLFVLKGSVHRHPSEFLEDDNGDRFPRRETPRNEQRERRETAKGTQHRLKPRKNKAEGAEEDVGLALNLEGQRHQKGRSFGTREWLGGDGQEGRMRVEEANRNGILDGGDENDDDTVDFDDEIEDPNRVLVKGNSVREHEQRERSALEQPGEERDDDDSGAEDGAERRREGRVNGNEVGGMLGREVDRGDGGVGMGGVVADDGIDETGATDAKEGTQEGTRYVARLTVDNAGNQLQVEDQSAAKEGKEVSQLLNTVKHKKKKKRRRGTPAMHKKSTCPVDLVNDPELLKEPEVDPRFKQFSLWYVPREDSLESKFGGHPTEADWENSYRAVDQRLHCGFVDGVNGSSGYDLDEKDREWMRKCDYVVSSAIFGNWDQIKAPEETEIWQQSRDRVCFAMFVDQVSLDGMISDGTPPDVDGKVGLWRVILVRNMPFVDPRRTGKIPKLLAHRLFPQARYSIWIDSKLRLRVDPMRIFEWFLWRKGYEYAIANHYARHCLHDEVARNKKLNKYNHSAIDAQFQAYVNDGMNPYNYSDPDGLIPSQVPEGSVIIRAHTPMSNLFSCLWFNEVDRWTSRDQISFGYVFQRLNRMNPQKQFYLGMFKDCERKALVKVFRHRGEDALIAQQRNEEAKRRAEKDWQENRKVKAGMAMDAGMARLQEEGGLTARDEVLRKRRRRELLLVKQENTWAMNKGRPSLLRVAERGIGGGDLWDTDHRPMQR
ncbi:hypothetical protein CBR_g40021 [Chara braunii]|uniref:TOD1/MUCI70 glycosyltransferase-like domain-containing protein n=1 Tax=Chara braunii TaxID=69332 RepID=A0A388LSS0_CHABU|nr:hypothetical protein CBR_g40021 [Chara braunii]|eukprot:GBG85378.1 hypothetical protein CBR_g40021 [Chara braunii]